MKKHTFLLCGTAGWCMEILWTGVHAIQKKDFRLIGQSSNLDVSYLRDGCLYQPVSKSLKGCSTFLRGSIYMTGILRRSLQRRAAEAFSYVSLGLQQGQA